MNDVLAEEALPDEAVEEPSVGAPPSDGEGLQGYNPSDGEVPLEAQTEDEEQPDEAVAPTDTDGEEPEAFPEDPDDTPAVPDPGEEEYEREPTAEEQTIVRDTTVGVGEPEPGLETPGPAADPAEDPDDSESEEPTGPDDFGKVSMEQLNEAKAESQPKSKSRVYLVFEEHGRSESSYKKVPECLYTGAEQIKLKEAHADDPDYEVPTGELRSRNGDNARRAAYRRLAAARENEDLRVTLVIVAESSWRPTPIRPRQRNLPPALEIG
jgi:hypothetical protein